MRLTCTVPGERGGLATACTSSDAELWVTPEVWERVEALVREASELVHAEAKPPRSPGTVHVNLTAATFRMREETQR